MGQKLAMLEMLITAGRVLFVADVAFVDGLKGSAAGRGELGWGRREEGVMQYRDAFVAQRLPNWVSLRRRVN